MPRRKLRRRKAARADVQTPNESADSVPTKYSSNATADTEMKAKTTDEDLKSISFKDVPLAKDIITAACSGAFAHDADLFEYLSGVLCNLVDEHSAEDEAISISIVSKDFNAVVEPFLDDVTTEHLWKEIEKRVAAANILEMELKSSLRKNKREKQKTNSLPTKPAEAASEKENCDQTDMMTKTEISNDIPPLPGLRRQLSDELYEKLLAENTADSKEDNIEQVNEIMAVQTIFPGDVFIIPTASPADRARAIDIVVQIDVGDEPRIKLICNVDNHAIPGDDEVDLMLETLAKVRVDHADAEEYRGQLFSDLERSAKDMEATIQQLVDPMASLEVRQKQLADASVKIADKDRLHKKRAAILADQEIKLQRLQSTIKRWERKVEAANSRRRILSPDFTYQQFVALEASHSALLDFRAVKLRCLPPFRVRFHFTSKYPSEAPLKASLVACEWMSVAQRNQVNVAMQKFCDEIVGEPMVYACVDWLKSNAVKVLATPTKHDDDHDVYDATAAVMEKIEQQVATQSSDNGREKVEGAAAAVGSATGSASTIGGRSNGAAAAAAAAPKPKHRGPPVRVRRRGKARPPRRKKSSPNQATAVSPALRVVHQRAQQQFMRHLMRYDKLLEKERFDVHEHECESCYDEKPGREFFIVPSCGHKRVCRECLKSLCELAVKNKQFDQLVCPEMDCESRLDASTIMQLLPPETFRTWKKSYEIQLMEKRGAVYCPRCNENSIQTPVVPEDSGLGVCTRCEFPFCVDCMMPWHPGSRCISSSQRLRSIERQISHLGSVASSELTRKANMLREEMKTMEMVMKTSRVCPHCKFRIIKSQGCNKMTCSQCGKYFCYICNQPITGYSHFSSGKCKLFDQQALDQWERQMANPVMPAGDMMWGGGFGLAIRRQNVGPPIRCVHCGQHNYKTGRNNRVMCTSCGAPTCAVCKRSLKGKLGKNHFGAGRCPQHSL